MQLKMTNGDRIILKCWTDEVAKKEKGLSQPFFVEKTLSLYIENNHLFIVDNTWNSLAIKKMDYSKFSRKQESLTEMDSATIKIKPEKFDGIAIDLTANKECESIVSVRNERMGKKDENPKA